MKAREAMVTPCLPRAGPGAVIRPVCLAAAASTVMPAPRTGVAAVRSTFRHGACENADNVIKTSHPHLWNFHSTTKEPPYSSLPHLHPSPVLRPLPPAPPPPWPSPPPFPLSPPLRPHPTLPALALPSTLPLSPPPPGPFPLLHPCPSPLPTSPFLPLPPPHPPCPSSFPTPPSPPPPSLRLPLPTPLYLSSSISWPCRVNPAECLSVLLVSEVCVASALHFPHLPHLPPTGFWQGGIPREQFLCAAIGRYPRFYRLLSAAEEGEEKEGSRSSRYWLRAVADRRAVDGKLFSAQGLLSGHWGAVGRKYQRGTGLENAVRELGPEICWVLGPELCWVLEAELYRGAGNCCWGTGPELFWGTGARTLLGYWWQNSVGKQGPELWLETGTRTLLGTGARTLMGTGARTLLGYWCQKLCWGTG